MKPIVVLVRPQLSENIGAIARAMGNFGFNQLRVVSPIGEVINEKSVAMAAGNDCVLKDAPLYTSLSDAISDCVYVYATTAVVRDMVKPITTPSTAHKSSQHQTALVFGPERTGLTNDEIALCTHLMTIPVNPDFSSLNLGQAGVIVFYEWFKSTQNSTDYLHTGESDLSSFEQKDYFLQCLEKLLDDINYWRVQSKKAVMLRNIQNTFTRHPYTHQEIQTLIGIVKDLQ